MVTVISLLPTEVEERLARFLAEGCSGSIELHINAGAICGFKVIETGRIRVDARISSRT